jgi:hypothetical protein
VSRTRDNGAESGVDAIIMEDQLAVGGDLCSLTKYSLAILFTYVDSSLYKGIIKIKQESKTISIV